MTRQPFQDTVAALSTPPGKGGVALIRLCGEEAIEIAGACFRAKNEKDISLFPSRLAVYGNFYYQGEPVDDVLLTVFRAPHSYTGEDTVEIACHGSMLICRTILEALYSKGARPAQKGEFTRRAFLAGKINLTEAEAIAELLDAQNREQIKLFQQDSRSHLSLALASLYEGISSLLSAVYAKVDYPDEDLAELSREEILSSLEELMEKTERLCHSYKTGRAVAEGIYTVLLGKPNTGKSSLYNLLAGKDAAIVTEYAGTTRDILEASLSLGRVLLRLADTAGMRETDNPVEKIGVEKAKDAARSAELILMLFDTSSPFDEEDEAMLAFAKKTKAVKIALLNKSDLPALWDASRLGEGFAHILPISAKKGDTDALCACVDALFTDGSLQIGEDAIVFTARQFAALERAKEMMQNAKRGLAAGFAEDAALCELEAAAGALAETDGRAVSEDIVSGIFSKFCVGK